MKDYDDEIRDLEGVTQSFRLRGVEFVAKPVMPARHLSALSDMQTGADAGHPYETTTDAIRATLFEDYREQWDALLAKDHEVPISLGTLMKIADDLVEATVGRPPTRRTPSGSMGVNGSTRSTDGSGSTEAPASEPLAHARG